MGLLDDAIREHLELKRRHGAAADEVARQEAEAFGPARREAAAEPAGAELKEPQLSDAPVEAGWGEPPARADEAIAEEQWDEDEPVEAHFAEPFERSGAGAPPDWDEPVGDTDAATEVDRAWEEAQGHEPPAPPDEPRPAGPVDEEPALDEPLQHAETAPDVEEPPVEEPRVDESPVDEARVEEPPVKEGDTPPQGMRPVDPGRPRQDAPERGDEATDEDDDVLEETPDFLQETPEHDRLWFEQKPPRDFDFDD